MCPGQIRYGAYGLEAAAMNAVPANVPAGERRDQPPVGWRARTAIGAAYALVALASLWMRGGMPIHVFESGADDYLFIKLAAYLKNGEWLGPYDSMTLVKGMAYPGFIALSHLAGIPLKLA